MACRRRCGAGEPAKKARSAEGKRISIGFADHVIAYELRLGLPKDAGTAFFLDPVVKEETLRTLDKPRICKARDSVRVELDKQDGETRVAGRARLDEPAWKWTT